MVGSFRHLLVVVVLVGAVVVVVGLVVWLGLMANCCWCSLDVVWSTLMDVDIAVVVDGVGIIVLLLGWLRWSGRDACLGSLCSTTVVTRNRDIFGTDDEWRGICWDKGCDGCEWWVAVKKLVGEQPLDEGGVIGEVVALWVDGGSELRTPVEDSRTRDT